MKVLIYANDDLGYFSGISRYVDYLANVLIEHGDEPLIVGYAEEQPAVTSPSVMVRMRGHGVSKLETAAQAFRLALRGGYRVVLFTQLGAPINAPLVLLLRALGCRMIYVCMDPPPETYLWLNPRSRFRSAIAWFLALSDRIVDRCCCSTLTVSPGVDALMRGRGWHGPIRRFFNVHGVLTEDASDRSDIRLRMGWENALLLVYAGRLQRYIRGTEPQIEAVAIARRSGADVRLVIVGAGDPRYFREIAERLGVAESVLFLDTVSPAELHRILRSCDISVFASPAFALPSKVFEYLSCGLKLVSVAGPSDANTVLQHYVETYDGTPASLAELLARESRRERASPNAADFLQGLRRISEQNLVEAIDEAKRLR
jgi:glycosyltransferase involved in cell wall biosynthesis